MLCVLFSLSPALSPSLVLACEGWEWERFKAKQKEGKKLAKSLKGAAFRLHDSPRMVTYSVRCSFGRSVGRTNRQSFDLWVCHPARLSLSQSVSR